MKAANQVVFLLDIDNTGLSNDRILADLDEHHVYDFGDETRSRSWGDFEALHAELCNADYLGALQALP